MKEIIFAGSGGQGVLTSGLIISDIAASEGTSRHMGTILWFSYAWRYSQLYSQIQQ